MTDPVDYYAVDESLLRGSAKLPRTCALSLDPKTNAERRVASHTWPISSPLLTTTSFAFISTCTYSV